MYGARLLAHGARHVEIDIEKLLLGSAVGKLLHIVAELLNLVGGKPIGKAILHHSHRLGIQAAVVDGIVEGRVDALHIERQEP